MYILGNLSLEKMFSSKVKNMKAMFYNCKEIKSLNLTLFIVLNVLTIENIFL